MELAERLRTLPGVDEVAQRLRDLTDAYPRPLLIRQIRRSLEAARDLLRKNPNASIDIEDAVRRSLAALREPSLRRVINATGVVLHTNLGRAPLCDSAPVGGYSNLEYDLETGRRGRRDVHVSRWLEWISGWPGIAVNNNAAAVYLVLNEMAAGAEAIVSRGQLIEIGDGFRIPDIMQRAGVTLREVGATNRTSIEDYREAISERTGALLIVHPSNFRVQGFTGQPSRAEVAQLGKERGVPVYEDLGSGCVADLSPYGIQEPLVSDSMRDGVSIVSFSGDKLLGGPQCGIIAGDAMWISRIRRNPMFRALRLDKLILATLETTMRHLVLEEWDAVPALRMIRMSQTQIRDRATALLPKLTGLDAEIVDGESVIGGGSTPEQSLPTALIAIRAADVVGAEARLRRTDPPVIARISEDRILIDLRTVFPEEEQALAISLARACAVVE
ncbi:MAG: L-seryl-tRNA(Sec) selenium transferase [Candidatus Solibacter usitatus]|nr:L-seryl-tRNA(Sec) selenium transferase [Candidatus Solibacter usitatus]